MMATKQQAKMIEKADPPNILLKAENLSFSYQRAMSRRLPVVHDVSFEIYEGEFLCLLGPSGCGKTTLLRLIAGLEDPDGGVFSNPSRTSHIPKIGMVFQDLALFPHMSAARNIGYALRHLAREQRRTRTNEMLELVGLLDKRGAYPHELSGGQKQRLALARALARQPDLILLDEPFASQDISLRMQMRDDVMHILREAGVAALLVTHDPEEAMQFADRIAVMNEGRIQQIDNPSQIYNHPNSAFVASFFGQVNALKGMVNKGVVQTPLGSIEAPNIDDNEIVDVIIRPEALKLSAHNPDIDHDDPKYAHVHGFISERKYVGRSTLVHLDTCSLDSHSYGRTDQEDSSMHIHARVPGPFLENTAGIQDIFLDPSQIFVFREQ